jgi:hypothetical protein
LVVAAAAVLERITAALLAGLGAAAVTAPQLLAQRQSVCKATQAAAARQATAAAAAAQVRQGRLLLRQRLAVTAGLEKRQQ